ncbi:MAG TPA: glycosyltransferase, partial [Actinobacteria bacterium]|nr:glycosyltransferase [Actinomycetota bacterium]
MRESDEPGSADDDSRSVSTIAELRDELAKVREEADDRQTLLAQLDSLEARHAATTTNFERLKNRRAVRLALRIADLGSAKLRPLRSLRRTPRQLRRPHRTQPEVANTLRQMRPNSGRVEGPMVSIVVPTRNGAAHLRRLMDGLERRTAYRSFELIVVDNGSTDETAAVLASATSHMVNLLANGSNQTFSESCNQGAAAATGDLILFLNNDTDPINHGWLGAMVDSLVDEDHPDRVAVGAVLVYPQGRNTRAPGQAPLTVQHRGIAFNWVDGGPRPVNLGIGEDADDPELLETRTVAAATAACLMVRRTAFESVGGFTDRYVYGWEDVDLCMKLRHEGGKIVVSGEAVLF